jgi:hypothetical protein
MAGQEQEYILSKSTKMETKIENKHDLDGFYVFVFIERNFASSR